MSLSTRKTSLQQSFAEKSKSINDGDNQGGEFIFSNKVEKSNEKEKIHLDFPLTPKSSVMRDFKHVKDGFGSDTKKNNEIKLITFRNTNKSKILGKIQEISYEVEDWEFNYNQYLLQIKSSNATSSALFPTSKLLNFLQKFQKEMYLSQYNKEWCSSMRHELALITLQFLVAENDFIIDSVKINKIKRNVSYKKFLDPDNSESGYSKIIYDFLVDLMDLSFVPTLRYKSSEFKDAIVVPGPDGYMWDAYFTPNLDYSMEAEEVQNIPLKKIVFPTPQDPEEVFKEAEKDPIDFKEWAKEIIAKNLNFFIAVFDFNHPELFQAWAKSHIEDSKPLSDVLNKAVTQDLALLQSKDTISKELMALYDNDLILFKKEFKKYESRLALISHPAFEENIINTIMEYIQEKIILPTNIVIENFKYLLNCCLPILSHNLAISYLIADYANVHYSILNELENAIPGETFFETFVMNMHNALKKAESTQNMDHIVSGFYVFYYHIQSSSIRKHILNEFVKTVYMYENVIDETAEAWMATAPQTFFHHPLIKAESLVENPQKFKPGSS